MRVACVRNAYTIERLRNLWTRTVGACAHAQFPVILECPLINAADVENTRTWIYRRDDDGRWLETVQESGEVRGGREGRRENVQRELSLFRNSPFGSFENKIPIARTIWYERLRSMHVVRSSNSCEQEFCVTFNTFFFNFQFNVIIYIYISTIWKY